MMPVPNQINVVQPTREELITIKEFIEFMNTNGISKHEMADILGVTVQAINLWVKGDRAINTTVSRVIRIFKKYPKLIREFKS